MQRPQRKRTIAMVPRWLGQKPALPMITIPVYVVHYRQLERYIEKIYKMEEYSIGTATGARGDMTPEVDVTGVLPSIHNLGQLVDNIRRGRRTRNLKMIMDLLCQDGFIPIGKYTIDMSKVKEPVEKYAEVLSDSQDCLDRRCVALKEANKNDVGFMRQVKILDDKLLKHQEQLAQLAARKLT